MVLPHCQTVPALPAMTTANTTGNTTAERTEHRTADEIVDLLLDAVVPDLEAYERFVMDFTKIPGIAQIRSSFALRPVKQGTALPLSVSGR